MATFRLTLEYDGRRFAGWQVQAGERPTLQGALEAAIAQVTGEPARVLGAGRTDAGVHAEAQVASVALAGAHEADWLQRALNGVLPEDIAVRRCEPVPDDFHPRFHARRKLYRYCVWNGAQRSPLRRERTHWVRSPLDVAAMRSAAEPLVGTHDFAAFQAAGSDVASSVRTLEHLDVLGEAGGELRIEATGSGFLRHMVRILVGTLLEVGLGRRPSGELVEVLAARDRARAGRTAPAHALTLVRIDYDDSTGPEPPSGRNSR